MTVGTDSSMLRMSIVIGTLNRCEMLTRSLNSIERQTCDPRWLEIIVVDNGSTDRTSAIVAEFATRMANLRYVLESTKGLSTARNRGIAEARAELVAFMDDDGEAEPNWAETVLRVFMEEPNTDAVGGPVLVRWPNEQNRRPDWMSDSLLGYYGGCYYGPVRRPLSFPEYPFGPNMVIRRDRLNQIHGFDSRLGPTGENLMVGGETDMFYRLHQLSPKVIYEPSAIVHHWTTTRRMTRTWCLKRAFTHGISIARMQFSNDNRARAHWLRRAVLGVWRMAISAFSTSVGWITRAKPAIVMSRCATTVYWTGNVRGAVANLVATRITPSLPAQEQ